MEFENLHWEDKTNIDLFSSYRLVQAGSKNSMNVKAQN